MSDQDNNNKTDDQKKKKVDRKKLSSEYQVPEYIDVEVVEPITHQENGKDSYTTYKINVIVRTYNWYNANNALEASE